MELSYKSLGRELHAVDAEKAKLLLQNVFVQTGICNWPDVEDRREAQEGSTETGLSIV